MAVQLMHIFQCKNQQSITQWLGVQSEQQIEMETGAYITDIDLENAEHDHPGSKFTRFHPTETRSNSLLANPAKKSKHFNRPMHKNANSFLPDEYYAVKKIKPGIFFFKSIIEIEERRKNEPNLPVLHLNIAETLLLVDNTFIQVVSEAGSIKITNEMHFNDFIKKSLAYGSGDIFPTVLTGCSNGGATDFNIYLSTELDTRVMPKNQNQFAVRFVEPYAGTPNILRLFYVPKKIRGAKPNYAYKTINKKRLNEEIIEKKHKQLHNYVVDFDKHDLIVMTEVKGKALSEVEAMTESIIDYLQPTKGVKITEMIIDFIFGADRLYYFHDIKQVKSVSLSSVWDIGTAEQINVKYKQQINQTMCKLCGFFFSRQQISKLVTNKLIVELIHHLNSRGEKFVCNTLNLNKNLSGSSNVCDLCYELIVAEHKLIDIEQEFHSLVNVSSDQVVRVKNQSLSKYQFAGEQTSMNQWRMFFYVEKVKNARIDISNEQQTFSLAMKFNDVKQTFHRSFLRQGMSTQLSRVQSASALRSRRGLMTATSFRNQKKNTLTTNNTNRTYDYYYKQSIVDFQKIKLVTFYTSTTDITHILNNQDLSFELTYRNHKYRGTSSTLQNFSNKKQCQRHSCEVLLFNQKYQYCNLQLNVGLIWDGVVDTSSLSLKRSENGHVFYCDSVTSCHPLPPEWIETISFGLDENQIKTSARKSKQLFRVKSGTFSRLDSKKTNWKLEQSSEEQHAQYF